MVEDNLLDRARYTGMCGTCMHLYPAYQHYARATNCDTSAARILLTLEWDVRANDSCNIMQYSRALDIRRKRKTPDCERCSRYSVDASNCATKPSFSLNETGESFLMIYWYCFGANLKQSRRSNYCKSF